MAFQGFPKDFEGFQRCFHGARGLQVACLQVNFSPAESFEVVEIGVDCYLEGASVDSNMWRGPGTRMNSTALADARRIWRHIIWAARALEYPRIP